MSIQVDLTSDDVDRQINLLNAYPEIAEKWYKPTLTKDVQVLKDMILMGVPVRTGKAQKALGSRVTGKGTSIQGEVGWYGRTGTRTFYVRFLEGGAKAHVISPRGGHGKLAMKLQGMKSSDFALKFKGSDGSEHFLRRSVQNPGMSGRGFVQSAWDQAQTMVVSDLAMANEMIVRELAVP